MTQVRNNAARIKYKIVLLGDQGVGKTALIDRYIHNVFTPNYNATIGVDFLIKNVSYQDKHYRLHLWDTAGQERYKSLVTYYLKDSHCSIILYDTTKPNSINNAAEWLSLYNQHRKARAISFLVGNKIDSEESNKTLKFLEQKDEINKLGHFFVSAKEGTGIEQMFKHITQELNQIQELINTATTLDNDDMQQNPERMVTAKPLMTEKEVQKQFQTSFDKKMPMPIEVPLKRTKKCCF